MTEATQVTEITSPTDVSAGSAGGGITQTPAGISMGVDVTAPTPAQLAAPTQVQSDFLSKVPDEYKAEPWLAELAKNDNPLAAMFKEHKNALALVGRKGEGLKVPGADATPEQWSEFHKAIGVPEKPDDYAYEAPKMPEGLEQFGAIDEGLLKSMKEAAHKAGVTPDGWKKMVESYHGYHIGAVQSASAAIDAQLKATQESFAKAYGDKSPQVLANFDKATSGAPEWAKPILNALQPATKAALASVLFNFQTKYVGEDKLDIQGATPTAAPMTETEYGNRYAELFAKVRETSRNPSSAEHLKAKSELAKLTAFGREQVFVKRG